MSSDSPPQVQTSIEEIHDEQQRQQSGSYENVKLSGFKQTFTTENHFIKDQFENNSTQEIDYDITNLDEHEDVCTTFEYSKKIASVEYDSCYYLVHLNQQQKEVVLADDGVHIVIAGPGSGKTRVICYRIAHLIIKKGVMPEEIILLTFTNKAAKEMKERVISLVGMEKARRIQMGTFHSMSARLIRLNASNIGISNRFTICDEDQASSIIKKIITELKSSTNKNPLLEEVLERPKSILQAIQKLRNSQLPKNLTSAQQDLLHTLYSHYETRKKHLNMLDFDDLLVHAIRLFKTCPQLANTFRYVLVDEVSME